MSTKKKAARSRKKKIVNPYLEAENVLEEQDKLKVLQQSKKDIEDNIKKIVDDFNSKTAASNKEGEKFLEKLPLDSLKEFNDFSSGKKKESSLQILKLRTKLRKEKEAKDEELAKIDSQIAINNIDILLAKIKFLVKEEDKKEEVK